MIQFSDVYSGCRVLVTGHTGFKGSWLAFWLNELGARVAGISLSPCTQPNHWDLLNLFIDDHCQDIRDLEKIATIINTFRPEIVFHLAAQPLVRQSYIDPIDNWSSNVMGTAHVLEACRQSKSVRAVVAITTDKVYANFEWPWGYRENDRLGGHDPYSASKAACELLIDSYRNAFFSHENLSHSRPLLLASVRAGNVIGGGDWSEDRLIPDLVRSVAQGKPLIIRSPHATRPWQHVLECLAGYLLLGQKLLENDQEFATAWNFGSNQEDNRTVETVLSLLQSFWPELMWEQTKKTQPHESTLLYLDYAKAREKLNWQPVWGLDQTLQLTADWYRQYQNRGIVLTNEHLTKYINDACTAGATWINTQP